MKHLDPPSCVVIMSGYEEPMNEFLAGNPGLHRRIPYRYRFRPYAVPELVKILYIIAKSAGQQVPASIGTQLEELLKTVNPKTRANGNGGLMKNWLSAAMLHRDTGVNADDVKTDISMLDRLTLADFKATLGNLDVQQSTTVIKGVNQIHEKKIVKLTEYKDPKVRKAVDMTLREAFAHYDRNDDGFITPSEMLKVYSMMKANGIGKHLQSDIHQQVHLLIYVVWVVG
jgi:hypothetical protein